MITVDALSLVLSILVNQMTDFKKECSEEESEVPVAKQMVVLMVRGIFLDELYICTVHDKRNHRRVPFPHCLDCNLPSIRLQGDHQTESEVLPDAPVYNV